MALTVNSNIASLNAQRNLSSSSSNLSTSLERLSSGSRINSAKDDAAGLQISNRLTSQINGLGVAVKNANDGISIAQTAEGALQESTNILQRMRDLSLQAANGSNSDVDRDSLQKEVSSLQSELTRIADTTSFGTQKLLDGTFGSKSFQVGSNANETISVSLSDASSGKLGENVKSGAGGVFGAAAAAGTAYGVATGATDMVLSGNLGTSVGTDVSTQNAKDAAATLNALGTGVEVSTKVSVELANFTAADTGTLFVGDTEYDLSKYNGSAKELAAAIGKDGYSATFDSTTNKLTVSAEGVEGIRAEGTASGTLTIANATGGTVGASDVVDVGGVVVNSELKFSSSDAFTVTGGTGTTAAITSAGTTSTLASVNTIDIRSQDGAQDALSIIDAALASIDSQRADLGAVQNRFDSTISNLQNIGENASAARARIMDTDYAAESANLAKNQIMQQAGTAMLAQANQLPQAVLSLLG
ncbi:flagellin [Pseudomonas neustonica]|jgi:flagellin|uniref:Flagellin n=1 Tax=Pseudomonas neustonica TaxID=2487346 RepID=A0ABX9XMT8_9PSED|nr:MULTISPECIES: flagellin [Pseudomonas]MBA6420363.1 flagellin [Pseudomonas sp. 5Ae-yellow]ROZ87055.1 flagellin [Pseudomonas sp. SSM44]ROZ88329.1 flagellin [Pseudomonas neustonica]|tara:strand:- start:2157 stop:3578 length:1422 start_codon:yes stop_codon:yes gene_type:complete